MCIYVYYIYIYIYIYMALALGTRVPDLLEEGAAGLARAGDHGAPAGPPVVGPAGEAAARGEGDLAVLPEVLQEDGGPGAGHGARPALAHGGDALVRAARRRSRVRRHGRRAGARRPGDGERLHVEERVRDAHRTRHGERVGGPRPIRPEEREGHVPDGAGARRPGDTGAAAELASRFFLFFVRRLFPPHESSMRAPHVSKKGGEQGRKNSAQGAEEEQKQTGRASGDEFAYPCSDPCSDSDPDFLLSLRNLRRDEPLDTSILTSQLRYASPNSNQNLDAYLLMRSSLPS